MKRENTEEEKDLSLILPLFNDMTTCEMLLRLYADFDLLVAMLKILNPNCIVFKDHVFRKESFLEGLVNRYIKILPNAEAVEKVMNRVIISGLFRFENLSSTDTELKNTIFIYSKQIAELIASNWKKHLKILYPTQEFCIEMEPYVADVNEEEVETYAVTFYQVRSSNDRATFQQILLQILPEKRSLPSIWKKRLDTNFRRKYFCNNPSELENIVAKPKIQGIHPKYLVKEGKLAVYSALCSLVESLQREIHQDEEHTINPQILEEIKEEKLLLDELEFVLQKKR